MSEDVKKAEPRKIEEMETGVGNDVVITIKGKSGSIYRFSMPFGVQLTEGYDAACNAANKVADLFKEQVDRAKAKKEEEPKKEEEKGTE